MHLFPPPMRLPRRLRYLALLLAFGLLGAPVVAQPPAAPAAPAPVRGLITLGEGAIAYVPASAARAPAPVLILLHGAGGRPRGLLDRFRAAADANGLVLLAPRAAGRTWDLILAAASAARSRGQGDGGTFRVAGGDAARIEAALGRLGDRLSVDPSRTVLAGFSDGASYALSVGPVRPDLYRAILAFSPGFAARPPRARGRQPVFVAHGRADRVLPFARSRAAVLPALEAAGHPVTYLPFDGGHTIPDEAIAAALRFLEGFASASRSGL